MSEAITLRINKVAFSSGIEDSCPELTFSPTASQSSTGSPEELSMSRKRRLPGDLQVTSDNTSTISVETSPCSRALRPRFETPQKRRCAKSLAVRRSPTVSVKALTQKTKTHSSGK